MYLSSQLFFKTPHKSLKFQFAPTLDTIKHNLEE